MAFTPDPIFVQKQDTKQAAERDDKTFEQAMACMQRAVEYHKDRPESSNATLCETAEWIWRWANSESALPYGEWPKPQGAQ